MTWNAGAWGISPGFEPNDLGKVDFRATPLRIEDGDLVIERHDRLIRFHKSSAP